MVGRYAASRAALSDPTTSCRNRIDLSPMDRFARGHLEHFCVEQALPCTFPALSIALIVLLIHPKASIASKICM